MTQPTKKTASAAYRERATRVRDLMDELERKLADHEARAVGTTNWGFVGDMAHIEELLTQATEFLAPAK